MAKGNIFEISGDKDSVGCLHDELLYSDLGYLNAENVSDIDEDRQDDARNDLIKQLKSAGAKTGCKENTPWVMIDESVKIAFFAARCKAVKRQVEEMTAADFAVSGYTFSLSMLVRDTISDYVYYDGGYLEPLDDFIREADPETKYYLGNVICMR